MKNIKAYTTTVKLLSYFLIPLSIIGLWINWLVVPIGSAPYFFLSSFFANGDPGQIRLTTVMPLSHRIIGMLVDGVATGFIIAAFLLIISLMSRFERAEFFSSHVASLFMRLSSIMFLWALYAPLNRTLLSTITTWHNAPGHRMLSVSFGSSDLFNILVFCFLMIVAALIQKGNSLQHDQDLTV